MRFVLHHKMRIGLAEIQNVVAGELAERPILGILKYAYNFRLGGVMINSRLICGVLIAMLPAWGMAQEHEHGIGEKLGAVHFSTSCNGGAQKEFNRALALL